MVVTRAAGSERAIESDLVSEPRPEPMSSRLPLAADGIAEATGESSRANCAGEATRRLMLRWAADASA